MKVLAKALMMVFLIGAMSPLLAKEDNLLETLVTLKDLEKGKVELTYLGKQPEKLQVVIYNEDEQKVFREIIKSKRGVKKPYNISKLPFGIYRFEVRVADEIVIHKVSHKAPPNLVNVKLLTSPVEKSKIRMMVVGPEVKDFQLLIYDVHRDKLLFEENFHQSGNIGRIINLQATGAKTVRLVLSHKNDVVQSRTINL